MREQFFFMKIHPQKGQYYNSELQFAIQIARRYDLKNIFSPSSFLE